MPIDIKALEASTRRMAYSRQVNQLADALSYALNIQHGTALVPFLAPLNARDNREAVACWVSQELSRPDIELSQHCVQILLPRLEKRLSEIQEVCA